MQFLLHGNSQSYREEDIKIVLFYFNYTKDCKRSEGKECSHMGSLRYIYCGIQIILYIFLSCLQGFPGSSAGKESTCRAGDAGSVPVSADPLKKGQATYPLQYSWAFLVVQQLKNLPAMLETWVGKIPWRRAGLPTPVFLSGESQWTEEPEGLQPMGSQRGHHKEAHSTESQ